MKKAKQGRFYWIREFNKRIFNPIMLNFAGDRIYAVVHHKGRKSGRAYKNPVLAMPADDGFIIPLTYGPDTDWCLNIRSAGEFELKWKGETYQLYEPEIIDLYTAKSAFPGWLWSLLRLFRVKQGLHAKQ